MILFSSKTLMRCCAAIILLAGLNLALGCGGPDRSRFIPPANKYDARILRDTWGVPHVFGQTDADAAYALGYAHSEDDWKHIEDAVLVSRARLAAVRGKKWAKFDYIMHLFKVRAFVTERYERELSPEVRAVVEAYADGINHFAAVNPGMMPGIELPVTGQDIVCGFTLKAPFFYELHVLFEELMGDERLRDISGRRKNTAALLPTENPFTRGLPIGSNAWAVGPSRSADGATRLAVNSHQPWDGPVAWYEAHIHSEEGWNMTGGTFPGGPMIFSGHDENKGWCHTVNRPDLADVYVLEMHPEDEYRYRYDGAWRELERDTCDITVRLWGPFTWTVTKELLWSVHGPVVRADHGTYALRFAGYGEVKMVEQWYRMNKARNLEEFRAAMAIQGIPSFNTVYADKEGNLYYAYNGLFPDRRPGWHWDKYLPGDTVETVWEDFLPFSAVPQVINPPSGFIQSCNSAPYSATVGDANPKPEDFAPSMGIETIVTNRSLRALETYGQDPSITRGEVLEYKYDTKYSDSSAVARQLETLFAADIPGDPQLERAVELLKGWDRRMEKENEVAALGYLAAPPHTRGGQALGRSETDVPDSPVARLQAAVDFLMKHHGALEVPWGEIMRLRRGDVDRPLTGAAECLRVIRGERQTDGTYTANYGDGLIVMVEWDKEGKVHSESIHQYGAATLDEDSPHYDDQAPLFAREELKPVLLTEAQVRKHLKREYRPGEDRYPWYE